MPIMRVVGVCALLLSAGPASAGCGGGHGCNNWHGGHHHGGGIGPGAAAAIGLGGLLVGGALAGAAYGAPTVIAPTYYPIRAPVVYPWGPYGPRSCWNGFTYVPC